MINALGDLPQEAEMKVHGLSLNRLSAGLAVGMVLPLAAWCHDGIVAPAADTLWPQWQARVALQTSMLPLGLPQLLEGGSTTRSWQGGAMLGDYYFAKPSFGSFRASGGLMFGSTGGAPLSAASLGTHLALAVQGSGVTPGPGAEMNGTIPYLGLGFTGSAWHRALALTADLGWVAEQPSAAGGLGRALLGSQGRENAWRELRLSPVLQVALRYSF